MKTTRRGFFGLIVGAVAAALAPPRLTFKGVPIVFDGDINAATYAWWRRRPQDAQFTYVGLEKELREVYDNCRIDHALGVVVRIDRDDSA